MTRKVIIAEDSEPLRNMLVRILSLYEGIEAEGVENGAELVEKVKDGACDIAFTDYEMPVMDGIGAVIKIREFSDIPIYMNSGSNDETLKQRALESGVTGFSTKYELMQLGREYYREILVLHSLIG